MFQRCLNSCQMLQWLIIKCWSVEVCESLRYSFFPTGKVFSQRLFFIIIFIIYIYILFLIFIFNFLKGQVVQHKPLCCRASSSAAFSDNHCFHAWLAGLLGASFFKALESEKSPGSYPSCSLYKCLWTQVTQHNITQFPGNCDIQSSLPSSWN